jgi:4a-hydroxytetrahydrobiopterin dehydratase
MKNLSPSEIKDLMQNHQLEHWTIGETSISKTFKLKDFINAMAFMNSVGIEAEKMNHHPNWSNVYNKVDVELSTHDTGGVTEKDIELAKVFEDKYKNHIQLIK